MTFKRGVPLPTIVGVPGGRGGKSLRGNRNSNPRGEYSPSHSKR